ncbi:hypothetical protein Ancab_006280 [Ancistrocladus abbreviatus]
MANFGRKKISVPVRVQGLERVQVIAIKAFHNLALEEDGILWAWGDNEYGQLGTGDVQPRAQPVPVQGLFGVTLVAIAGGGWHSTAWTYEGQWMVAGPRFEPPGGAVILSTCFLLLALSVARMNLWLNHLKRVAKGLRYMVGVEENTGGWDLEMTRSQDREKARLFREKLCLQQFLLEILLFVFLSLVLGNLSCGGTHSVALTHDGRMFSYGRGDHGRLGYVKKVTRGHPMEGPMNLLPPKELAENAVAQGH